MCRVVKKGKPTMSNVYGPNNIPDWFWEIIARAQNSRKKLKDILMMFDYDQLKRFHIEYQRAAGYLAEERFVEHMDGQSEDNVEVVTRYIVGRGKEYYMDVWNHPEHTPAYRAYDDTYFGGVPGQIMLEKFEDYIDDFDDY